MNFSWCSCSCSATLELGLPQFCILRPSRRPRRSLLPPGSRRGRPMWFLIRAVSWKACRASTICVNKILLSNKMNEYFFVTTLELFQLFLFYDFMHNNNTNRIEKCLKTDLILPLFPSFMPVSPKQKICSKTIEVL